MSLLCIVSIINAAHRKDVDNITSVAWAYSLSAILSVYCVRRRRLERVEICSLTGYVNHIFKRTNTGSSCVSCIHPGERECVGLIC